MSDKIKCLIVDDEPIASRIVQTYCGHIPSLEIIAVCSNALEAKAILQKQAVDLIFLDINMPVLDGIAFLKTLKNPPQVIFATAYKEHAIDGFDLALDLFGERICGDVFHVNDAALEHDFPDFWVFFQVHIQVLDRRVVRGRYNGCRVFIDVC